MVQSHHHYHRCHYRYRLAVVPLILTLISIGVAEAQSPIPTCISNLIPCVNYINSTKPPPSCCNSLRTAVAQQLDCLCYLYENPNLVTSFGINVSQALQLPRDCGIPASDTDCKALAPSSASSSSKPPSPGHRFFVKSGKKHMPVPLIILIISVIVIIVILLMAFVCFMRESKKTLHLKEDEEEIPIIESLNYSLKQVQNATNNFSEDCKIGKGGFGIVYKGTLPNGEEVAVKRLSKSSMQGLEEFKNEILLVAKLQHRNLVRLLGFCFENQEMILIYEFFRNKSLDQFLFDPEKRRVLDWKTRYVIIRGIARGLLYLHEDSRLKIIHRDLKASNVLLDENMNPKIADFGTARLLQLDQSEENTRRIAGTYGYMAPEYALFGQISVKSDVFSFGVLLLEIISGQKNNTFYQSNGVDDLRSYAWKNFMNGVPLALLDPSVGELHTRNKEVIHCIHIGLLCVQGDPQFRPTMASVVIMLSSNAVALPIPVEPAFFATNFARTTGIVMQQSEQHDFVSGRDASFTELYPR